MHVPGTGEQIASLQEDDAEAVDRAISAARDSFASGRWSDAGTATRQAIFRKAARLIRDNAEELALLECLCAGLPSSHLASRQVPRAADNLDFFADYIGVMAGETFDQLSGYQTQVTRQPAGVAALFAPWNAPLALSSMQLYNEAVKAAAVLQYPEIAVAGNGKTMEIAILDSKNQMSDEFSHEVGETTFNFKFVFKVENFSKLMSKEYNVFLSSKGLSRFDSSDNTLTYYIALEPTSTFEN